MVVCDEVQLSPGAGSFNICCYEPWGGKNIREMIKRLISRRTNNKVSLYPLFHFKGPPHPVYCHVSSGRSGIFQSPWTSSPPLWWRKLSQPLSPLSTCPSRPLRIGLFRSAWPSESAWRWSAAPGNRLWDKMCHAERHFLLKTLVCHVKEQHR